MPAIQRGVGAGQLGTGVTVAETKRIRDAFTDQQIRQEAQELGRWATRRDLPSQVELIFNEPSDWGIREAMDLFWQSLQGLSQHPEDMSYRAVVRQRAMVLADAFQDARRQLLVLRADVNLGAGVKVEEINAIAQQIASLNSQIGKIIAVGDVPNDLFDKRDPLLEQLAEIVNISVSERHQGMISVNVGALCLLKAPWPLPWSPGPRPTIRAPRTFGSGISSRSLLSRGSCVGCSISGRGHPRLRGRTGPLSASLDRGYQ